jgi:hypothetical protein
MKTRQRLESGVRREIERIAVPDNTQAVPQPQPQVPTVSVGGTGKPVVFNLRFQEKTGGKAVDFVRTVIIPTGKLITGTNTAELLFDTLPNGTIHQTLRHTGVGTNTWEATSRIETRQSSTLVGIPFDKGCVDIRGYTDTFPLLNIGSNAETSTGWGLRINMPLGQGILASTLKQNYIQTLGDALPYSFKIANLDTIGSFPVLELRSNHAVNAGIGIDLRHNSRGINIEIPSSTAAGTYVTYGIKVQYSPIYDNTIGIGSPRGNAIEVITNGKAKRGLKIDINTTGEDIDDEDLEGARILVPANAVGLSVIGQGAYRSSIKPVCYFASGASTSYVIVTEGKSLFGGNVEISTGNTLQIGLDQIATSRRTGWAAPTGTATRTTFNTATVTLAQLAERVKALIDDLTTHGLIGA